MYLDVRVRSLDSLRGIAALMVVLHHCAITYFPESRPSWITHTPLRLLVDGHAAVLTFFALSGFVLFHSFTNVDRFDYFPYIVKRFTRIYPAFGAAVLLSAALWVLVKPHPIPALGAWFNNYSWQPPWSLGIYQ